MRSAIRLWRSTWGGCVLDAGELLARHPTTPAVELTGLALQAAAGGAWDRAEQAIIRAYTAAERCAGATQRRQAAVIVHTAAAAVRLLAGRRVAARCCWVQALAGSARLPPLDRLAVHAVGAHICLADGRPREAAVWARRAGRIATAARLPLSVRSNLLVALAEAEDGCGRHAVARHTRSWVRTLLPPEHPEVARSWIGDLRQAIQKPEGRLGRLALAGLLRWTATAEPASWLGMVADLTIVRWYLAHQDWVPDERQHHLERAIRWLLDQPLTLPRRAAACAGAARLAVDANAADLAALLVQPYLPHPCAQPGVDQGQAVDLWTLAGQIAHAQDRDADAQRWFTTAYAGWLAMGHDAPDHGRLGVALDLARGRWLLDGAGMQDARQARSWLQRAVAMAQGHGSAELIGRAAAELRDADLLLAALTPVNGA